MKNIARLLHRKGFTLVECIIAIAVFAVLTSMVVMIVGNAVVLSKDASKAEEDLNNVVQNVVEDETNRVYGSDSRTLEMHFNSDTINFRATYSTVDGYKNFVECPNCHKQYNNLEFMSYIYDTNTYKNWPAGANATKYPTASAEDKKNFKISYWFGAASETSDYKCPNCDTVFSPGSLNAFCTSCNADGDFDVSSNTQFIYNPAKGTFRCSSCSSENVVQRIEVTTPSGTEYVPITSNLTSDSSFMVSGLTANAIRYGTITKPTDKETVTKFTDATGSVKCTAYISYTESTSSVKPGTYTLKLDSLTGADDAGSTVTFTLPGCYSVKVTGGTADGEGGHATATAENNACENAEKTSFLKISGITSSNASNIQVEFTLTNYRNGHSFEEDYKNDAGVTSSSHGTALGVYWFCTSAGTNNFGVPRTEASVILK